MRQKEKHKTHYFCRGFQQVAGLKDNGRLTKKTLEKMRLSRCGNIDVESTVRLSKLKKRFGNGLR